MPLLLLWQPRAPNAPPAPPAAEAHAVVGDIGSGRGYQRAWHDARARRDEQDEEDMLQLIAIAVPILERR